MNINILRSDKIYREIIACPPKEKNRIVPSKDASSLHEKVGNTADSIPGEGGKWV